MKQEFIVKNDAKGLFLVFLGWGMDSRPFEFPIPADADIMLCYDYRTLDFNTGILTGYSAIYVIGWSMGVWAASQVLQNSRLPIRQRIAYNGTLYPIDKQKGIDPAVFQATLDHLNEESLLKFYRRMCDTKEEYQEFLQRAPRRSIESLREELIAIGENAFSLPTPKFEWNMAAVGLKDRIFLPDNQIRAWQGTTKITEMNVAHYSKQLFN